jgi:hypothetical protein
LLTLNLFSPKDTTMKNFKKLMMISAMLAMIPAVAFAQTAEEIAAAEAEAAAAAEAAAEAGADSLVGGTPFTGTFTTTAGNYVSDSFSLTTSDSVGVGYVESATAIGVETAHPKGTTDANDAVQTYGGSSNGGAVAACVGDLTAVGCAVAG